MVADQSIDFQTYLESLCNDDKYRDWQNLYTPIDALDRQLIEPKESRFRLHLSLMVQTIQPSQPEGQASEREKIEPLNVLKGLRNYAAKHKHILLVGRPGSGKSTALERLLWEEAQKARGQDTFPTPLLPHSSTPIPVLVELRQYTTSVLDLIRKFLSRHQLRLDKARIETLLFEGRFLLLVDGVNELPNEDARRNLNIFRQNHPATPMIFTTRDLGVGGDLDIKKKLEMQPLSEGQIRQFVRAYLLEKGDEMLRRLGEKLRDFAQTPHLLEMLCELFRQTGDIPPNLGLVFRCFAQIYNDKFWDSVQVPDEFRHFLPELLPHLAFMMIQGASPTELRVSLDRREAELIITKFLEGKVDYPATLAKAWLQYLVKHHLIQLASNNQIEFRHQLLQEYYAAEFLLQQLPNIKNEKLQRDYLNYLKWTEPVALMLALVDYEVAIRVVQLALDVDLQLGARLAGDVKREFQEETVGLVAKLKIPQQFKMRVLGTTRSNCAIPILFKALENQDDSVRWFATEALGKIVNEATIAALSKALQDKNDFVRRAAFDALEKIGTKAIIPALRQSLKDDNTLICEQAIYLLGDIAGECAIPELIEALAREDTLIRNSSLCVLAQICGIDQIPELIQDLADRGFDVHSSAFSAIRLWHGIFLRTRTEISQARLIYSSPHSFFIDKMRNETVISSLYQNLSDKDPDVCKTAVYVLGQIGTEEAIAALCQALDNENWRVRFDVVHWLAEIGSNTTNKTIFSYLLKALDDENSDVAGYTSYLLERKGIPELLPNLCEMILTVKNHIYSILEVISALQERCQYYNHAIATYPSPQKEETADTLSNTQNIYIKTPTLIM
ncbi:HEAT repeat domain-containing protein [Nostoc sp.]|uniref:HEAT repeat domain-containing protein n=1 Tax=Nostoc sp. TaxID=1180 RepID=UPI002FFBBC0F